MSAMFTIISKSLGVTLTNTVCLLDRVILTIVGHMGQSLSNTTEVGRLQNKTFLTGHTVGMNINAFSTK